MIEIPYSKYKGLDKIHYTNTKEYLKDAINFYINCCDIVSSPHKYGEYKKGIETYTHGSTLFSWIKIISKDLSKLVKKKSVLDVFKNNLILDEFIANKDEYKEFLTDMLKVSNDIYIEKIITSSPNELVGIYKHICSTYHKIKENGNIVFLNSEVNKGLLYQIITNIFDYNRFRNDGFKVKGSTEFWDAYKFCELLNVNVCPYFNRIYTTTVIKKTRAITRPELDHYMPQSKYPLFALSFYNLIPSCKVCNSSLKRDSYLDIDKYLHPYLDKLHEEYKFDYEPIDMDAFDGDKKKIKITINKNGCYDEKSDNSLEFFEITNIYKQHNDIVAKLLYKRKEYSDSRISEIVSILNSAAPNSVTKQEIYDSIFSTSKTEEIIDTSLGKLKKDIIDKLSK